MRAAKMLPAAANRMTAPQNAASSSPMILMPTALPPARTMRITNATSVRASGLSASAICFIVPVDGPADMGRRYAGLDRVMRRLRNDLDWLVSAGLLLSVAVTALTGVIADLWDLNDFWYHTVAGYVMGGLAVAHVIFNWERLVSYGRFRLRGLTGDDRRPDAAPRAVANPRKADRRRSPAPSFR